MRYLIALLLLTTACVPRVVRNQFTYVAEVESARKRQAEAATALQAAVESALLRGDYDECLEYAAPLAVLNAFGDNQATRSLYLAGLVEEDPGPSPAPQTPAYYCGGEE